MAPANSILTQVELASKSLQRQMIVKFEGEHGIDEGGLTQDFYGSFCRALVAYRAPAHASLVWQVSQSRLPFPATKMHAPTQWPLD